MRRSSMLLATLVLAAVGCDIPSNSTPVSSSGVSKATVKIATGPDGLTVEQRNIEDRLKRDNEPGSIKHLYVISSMTGDVLVYSTVRGKVTSGSKRLTPNTINGGYSSNGWYGGFPVNIGGQVGYTNEVLQDDGAYGSSSSDYLYWFDSKGIYHQQYAQGCIIHVSDQPLPVKHVVLNMELDKNSQDDTVVPAAAEPTKTTKKK